ncbi:putative reverse transcriptase domain-containing protein [Tanacetum coccineum]
MAAAPVEERFMLEYTKMHGATSSSWTCPQKCQRCQRIGHMEKDCRVRLQGAGNDFLQNVTCFGCGKKGHFKDKCPKSQGTMQMLELEERYVVLKIQQNTGQWVTGSREWPEKDLGYLQVSDDVKSSDDIREVETSLRCVLFLKERSFSSGYVNQLRIERKIYRRRVFRYWLDTTEVYRELSPDCKAPHPGSVVYETTDMSTITTLRSDSLDVRYYSDTGGYALSLRYVFVAVGISSSLIELFHDNNSTTHAFKVRTFRGLGKRLKTARSRQKSYADKRRKPLEFKVEDRVLLKVPLDEIEIDENLRFVE